MRTKGQGARGCQERLDEYLHSLRSASEGSGDNKGLNEKLDSVDKERIKDALEDGLSRLDSNPEADAKEFRSSHACWRSKT